jgi:hypothetical protein
MTTTEVEALEIGDAVFGSKSIQDHNCERPHGRQVSPDPLPNELLSSE